MHCVYGYVPINIYATLKNKTIDHRGHNHAPLFFYTTFKSSSFNTTPFNTWKHHRQMTVEVIIILIILGSFVGFIAGLFGIGGGMVIVPALMVLFDHWNMPIALSGIMAVATSIGCVVVTGGVSAITHLRNNNVDKSLLPKLSIGMALGGILGAKLGNYLGGVTLLQIFGIFTFFCAYRMFQPQTAIIKNSFPNTPVFAIGTGGFIGTLSNMVGIGGGILSVPLLVLFNTPTAIAIGTSSVLGVFLAIPGAISYALMQAPTYPLSGTIGYIYMPALFFIVLGSIFMAPVGARLTQKINANRLKRYAGILVLVAGINILWRSLHI